MSVREEIKARSIAALKARDKDTRARLSGVLGRFTEVEKSGKFDGWTDEKERTVVASYVKALKGAVKDMPGTSLADSYTAEIMLLEPYLPQLLGKEETQKLVEPLIAGCRSIGQLMGMVMKEHKGKVDPSLVRTIAAELGLK